MRIRASLAIVLVLLGFMVLTSATATRHVRRAAEPRRAQLVRLIRDRRSEVDGLSRDVVGLRDRLDRRRRHISRATAADARRLRAVQVQAGLVAVTGSGVEVVLRDSDRHIDDPRDAASLRISDADLQSIVNALWATGAEAIAINGQRLVTTSAIRIAGETVTVNFRPLVPPYRVFAIGADAARFRRSATARRFRHWVTSVGLGFAVHRRSHIVAPAFAGRVSGLVARPAPAVAPAPARATTTSAGRDR